MAISPWLTPSVGWTLTLICLWMAPTISFFLNKLFSLLDMDTSTKLQDLGIHTVPNLKLKLREAEHQRMVRSADDDKKTAESDLAALDELIKQIKYALYEAEDILDLVEYRRIEKEVNGSSCICRLGSRIATCCKRCFRASRDFAQAKLLLLRSCLDRLVLLGTGWRASRQGSRAEDAVPGPGVDEVSIPIQPEASIPRSEDVSVAVSTDEETVFQVLRVWFGNSCIPWIRTKLADAAATALDLHNWSNEAFGIRNNQEDGIVLYSFLHPCSRRKLRKKLERIDDILKKSDQSRLLKEQSNSGEHSVQGDRRKHRYCSPKIFGRDKEREGICSMLRDVPDPYGPSSSGSKRYSVVVIHGISGSGKSTLAQKVCDHEKELQDNDKHFDLFMFVHVSSSFNIFHDMLKEIPQQPPSDGRGPSLQDELKEKLKGRCFLLVLDDFPVNSKNREELRDLHEVLNCGKSGSSVLVTAQNKDAAGDLGAQKFLKIPELSKDQYFSLFMHHALQEGDSFEHKEYGRKIAEKLHQSPLAAVTVGAQLRKHPDIGFWERAATRDVLKETSGALWWSFQHLDADIRQCFAYCSTFPRGYKLKRDELVRMWVAQGFIKTCDEEYDLEDLGHDYFDELLAFAFLEQQKSTYSSGTEYFRVHDLLHELAERVAASDFFRIVSDDLPKPKDIPSGVRHLFIESNNGAEIAVKSQNLGNLRTLIINVDYTNTNRMQATEFIERDHGLEKVFGRLFSMLTKIRVLIIILNRKTEVLSVPAKIGRMKHLRYLCFRYPFGLTNLILPGTFSKLYHMQTIDLPLHCKVSCPEDMCNLIRLRHICSPLLFFPNIGRLTSLQTLACFRARRRQGFELKQLKHLDRLRGTLEIQGLGSVRSKGEALEAQLARKTRLKQLSLSFFQWQSRDPNVAAEVLEGLCPPKDLVELTIEHYKGSMYPSWMKSRRHPDAPDNLHRLELNACRRLAYFPNKQLFVGLRELHIAFGDWDTLPDKVLRLVSLKKLAIGGNDKIKLIPELPRSLEEIEISGCHVLSTTCQEEGHDNWRKIQHIPMKNFF